MSRIAGAFVMAVCCSGAASAQTPVSLPSVPKFDVRPSPIGLRGDVRPHQYVGVVGHKAAWLGWETGEAELWVHPIKLVNDFALDFQIPDYVDPVRGADIARTVEIRPELTTITYSHATFTVREHILAPLDEPGLLVLLDVETYRPFEIVVSFRNVFQYAWPGAFGGQYVSWNDSLKAFVLSESLRQRNGLIGSPWAATASSNPAHALPDAPSVFRIPIDPSRAKREFVPIAITAAIAPRDEVVATYRRLMTDAARLYQERRAQAGLLLSDTTRVETPDGTLDLAYDWARVNLAEQMVCNPDLGCGLVAGWGPSGQSTRPGFGWFFGGDAAINSLAMSSSGLTGLVAEELRFLAKYQRADGKITHEISQSAGRIPWFTEYPYAYYHADTTPYYIVAAWKYWRATGDDALLQELWPAIDRAFAWCLTTESDGDGLIENELGGLGAIEVGAISEGIHEDIYLASVWVEALQAMKEMGDARGDRRRAAQAQALLEKASATLNDKYWIESAGHHAFGLLKGGRVNDALTVWPSTALAFGLLDHDRGARTLEALSAFRMSADWGARMLAKDHPLYGPLEYNMGAVWPFVTGFVAWGHYNYGRPWAGYPLIEAIAGLTFDFARGRHPELLSGEYYRPLDTAVPHQFFATSMLVTPLLGGLFGWSPDAPGHRARLAPQLPPEWPHAALRGLMVGQGRLDAEFEQAAGRVAVQLTGSGPPTTVTFAPGLPPGATAVVFRLDGARVRPATDGERPAVDVLLEGRPRRVEVT
jgi:glycogen debranching enzyme